jgi:hypothetical protein
MFMRKNVPRRALGWCAEKGHDDYDSGAPPATPASHWCATHIELSA